MTRLARALAIVAALAAPANADRPAVLKRVAAIEAERRDSASWDRRRGELRRAFLEGAGMWPLPTQPPLNVIRHSLRSHDGYTVENVAIETLPGFYCTGNLYRPAGRTQPGAAILCPHGHFKPLGRFRSDQQVRCAHLARMGATVFSYSMVGWGDSTQTTHDDPNVLALQTWNSLKAVDLVSSLPGVDPKRIGVTGASGGGTQTFYLAFLDDRIAASAPAVILYPWAAPEGCLCEGGLPVMQAKDTNAIEIAAAIAPRPQLILSVGHDPTHDFPLVGMPLVRQAYAAFGHETNIESVHLPREEHDFGPSKRAAVYSFFARHLGLPLLDEELAKIAIEPPAWMEAFDASDPRPASAIRGAKQRRLR